MLKLFAQALRTLPPQTLGGSFSAVSKPNFARNYSLESSRRDLHNALLCTVFESHFFGQNFAKGSSFFYIFCYFSEILLPPANPRGNFAFLKKNEWSADFDNVYFAKNDHRWVTFISLKTIGLLLPHAAKMHATRTDDRRWETCTRDSHDLRSSVLRSSEKGSTMMRESMRMFHSRKYSIQQLCTYFTKAFRNLKYGPSQIGLHFILGALNIVFVWEQTLLAEHA